jgi:hypothetical protein
MPLPTGREASVPPPAGFPSLGQWSVVRDTGKSKDNGSVGFQNTTDDGQPTTNKQTPGIWAFFGNLLWSWRMKNFPCPQAFIDS